MIRLTDMNGREHLVAPAAVAHVAEAGPSSSWHGIRSNVRLTTGAVLEVRETLDAIRRQLVPATAAELPAAVRDALWAGHTALSETMMRLGSGYDWNADPEHLTLTQGDALKRLHAALEGAA